MNKRKKPRLGLLIMVGLLVYFTYIVLQQEKIWDEKTAEMNSIQAKVKDEEKLNQELKKESQNANSDENVEKAAREKLGMLKPGEKVYVDINK